MCCRSVYLDPFGWKGWNFTKTNLPGLFRMLWKTIETKVHKQNNLHLKCFPGFKQLLEYLVFMAFSRFLFIMTRRKGLLT